MKSVRFSAAVMAAACLLSFAGPAIAGTPRSVPASAATAPAVQAVRPAPLFRPPHTVAPGDVLSVRGAAGSTQTIMVQGVPSGVRPGVVVVSGRGHVAPAGLLVKVTKVARAGANTALTVVPAALAEALPPGNYTRQLELAPGSVVRAGSAGVSLRQPAAQSVGKSFSVNLSKAVKCSGNVSANITGHLSIRPQVNLSFVVGFGRINSASFGLSVVEDAALKASLQGAASCGASFTLATVLLPAFSVGPVPVTASLELKADASIGVSGSATISGSQHYQSAAGLNYIYGRPIMPYSSTSSTWNFDRPQLSGSGKLEVGVTGSVSLQVAALVGPRLDARVYLGAAANAAQTPWWRLYAGVTISGGLRLLVFNIGTWQIWHREWTLVNAFGILTQNLPSAVAGRPYAARVAAVGGEAPYSFSSPDALPTGLTLNADGTITGTPSGDPSGRDSTTTFRVVARDANGEQLSRSFTVAVHRMSITTATLPMAVRNSGYSTSLDSVGGSGAVTWSLVGGALPDGLSLSPSGTISGMVGAEAFTNRFTVLATDSTGASASASLTLPVRVVHEPPPIGPCPDAVTDKGPGTRAMPICR